MTEYVKSTNFASKDSLASGNPLKIVKGTEIDSEFNNIATAVATKADLVSPAFTSVPTAPTAAANTNTAQIATTAFVSEVVTNANSSTSTLTNKSINLSNNTVTGTKAQFNTACSDADFASLAGTETLTNKTVSMTSNTVTGTKAQFNTACTDTDFSFLNDFTGTNQTLAASGYQKLPGGLIMQWGIYDNGGLSGNVGASGPSITFPIAFPTALGSIQITEENNTSTTTTSETKIYSRSTSQFKLTGDVHPYTHWFAVGY